MPILLGPDGKPLNGEPTPPRVVACSRCGDDIELSDEMSKELDSVPGASVTHETCPRDVVPQPRYVFEIRVFRRQSDVVDDPGELLATAAPEIEMHSLRDALLELPGRLEPFWTQLQAMAAIVDD